MAERTGLWMYCLIENRGEMAWNCPGIHGTSPVYTVANGEFAVVVSEEPVKKYPLLRETLLAHQRVNETVMQTHPVLPVKFCTMAETKEKIIQEVLEPKSSEFRKKLTEISGKDEYGLRVRWKDLDKVFREIGQTDEKIQKKKELILSLPKEKRRNELIDIGHLVQQAVQQKNESVAQDLMNDLSPLAVEAKKNKTLGDAMILNGVFLVENEKQISFDKAVESLDYKYSDVLQFTYVGPVPPFNFVEIVINWKDQKTKEEPTYVSHR